MTKLIEIQKAPLSSGKKYTAIFEKDGKQYKIKFGARGYSDYTLGATDKQRENYRKRHAKESVQKPDTAGALSLHILWGESPDIDKNIDAYIKKFNL